jgi:amino acid transporter
MSVQPENSDDLAEKHAAPVYDSARDGNFSSDPENLVVTHENKLHQDLKGRHMQMIAMRVQHCEPIHHL